MNLVERRIKKESTEDISATAYVQLKIFFQQKRSNEMLLVRLIPAE